jgi:hypothetical protein
MSHKIYILQKDLPDAKAGQKYRQLADGHFEPIDDNGKFIGHITMQYRASVWGNPEWFLPEQEKPIQVQFEPDKTYKIVSVHGVIPTIIGVFDGETICKILKEIDNLCNYPFEWSRAVYFGRKYTEEDLRAAFEAGRELYGAKGMNLPFSPIPIYQDFEAYMNSRQKQNK